MCSLSTAKRGKPAERISCGEFLELARSRYSYYIDLLMSMSAQTQLEVAQKLKSISDEMQEARTRSSTNKQN
jgi:hypothetical protein